MKSSKITCFKFASSLLPMLFLAVGCSKVPGASAGVSTALSPSIPESELSTAFAHGFGCARAIDVSPAWQTKSREEIIAWLGGYGVQLVRPDIQQEYLAQFAAEFERIPEVFRRKAYDASGLVHILNGHGVTEDPSWDSGDTKTFDGRDWANVPGSGGFPYLSVPTRFVVNRLYEGHGSVNLVLHEFAHSLDSIRKYQGFSTGADWLAIAQGNQPFHDAIGSLCSTYCTDHPAEGLAEGFAVYYSCDSTRKWLTEHAPDAARWYGNFVGLL